MNRDFNDFVFYSQLMVLGEPGEVGEVVQLPVVEDNIHDQGPVLIHILKMVVCLVLVIQVVLTTVTQLLAQLRLQDNMYR